MRVLSLPARIPASAPLLSLARSNVACREQRVTNLDHCCCTLLFGSISSVLCLCPPD